MSQPFVSRSAAAEPSSAPRAIFWFRVYAVMMALIYVATITGISALFYFFEPHELDLKPFEVILLKVIMVGLSVVMLLMYLLPFALGRGPRVWIYDIVLIAIGLTSCLTLPFALPLLIFWLKPDVKRYFGRAD